MILQKVKNRTVANISDWPPEQIEALKAVLKGDLTGVEPMPEVEAIRAVELEGICFHQLCQEPEVSFVVPEGRSKVAVDLRSQGITLLFSEWG